MDSLLLNCMTLSIRNRPAALLIVSAVMLFVVTDVAVAVKCENTYYYASFSYSKKYYKTKKIRAFDISVSYAYIYDLPKLPSSWVYVIDNDSGSDRDITHITAMAKSDKHSIRVKDLNKFVILRQPKDKSEYNILIGLNLIYLKKEGGSGTTAASLDTFHNDLTIEKINKCLPIKPLRH
ncbi:MAG: hypothetical protein HQK99_06060 [Nitrospirae bacterium]|nr:hypothetical protein [Nitrospirota bacterium]